MPTRTQVAGLAIIVLFIAVAFPTFISASQSSNITETTTLEGEGDSSVIENTIRITLDSKTNDAANLTYVDLNSGDNQTIQLAEGESGNVQLDGVTVTATVLDIGTGTGGDVVVETIYPKSITWDSGSKTISSNLPIILVALALMIVLGLAGAVVE